MAIPLGRSSPSASCDRPERRREGSPGIPDHSGLPAAPTWSCSRWGFPCRRRRRRRGALLPHRFTLAGCPQWRNRPAVYFLWHFPWGRPRRVLPGTVPPWSPDFPLPAQSGERPSGRLAHPDLGSRDRLVKAWLAPRSATSASSARVAERRCVTSFSRACVVWETVGIGPWAGGVSRRQGGQPQLKSWRLSAVVQQHNGALCPNGTASGSQCGSSRFALPGGRTPLLRVELTFLA